MNGKSYSQWQKIATLYINNAIKVLRMTNNVSVGNTTYTGGLQLVLGMTNRIGDIKYNV